MGEDLKNSWVPASDEPPIPHAEELTLARFAETTRLPLDRIQANLRQSGLRVGDAEWTLSRMAAANGLTPQQLYATMQAGLALPRPPLVEGGGYGRKTLRQAAEQYGFDLGAGLARLAAQGIEALPDANVRELADAKRRSPIELVKILAGETEAAAGVPPGGPRLPAAR